MVRDTKNRIVGGLNGTKQVWLCLLDDKGEVLSRIGSIGLCKDCDISKIDCEELMKCLLASPMSGLPADLYEFGISKGMKIELIKTFGE